MKKMFNESMKHSMLFYNQLSNEMFDSNRRKELILIEQGQMQMLPDPEDEPTPQLHPLVELILPLIEQYAPMILGPLGNTVVSQAKQNFAEQFEELKGNPEATEQLKKQLIISQGEEDATAIFKKVGV